jgi:hypothetical protein
MLYIRDPAAVISPAQRLSYNIESGIAGVILGAVGAGPCTGDRHQ